jgi:hypothetical protein
MKKFALGVSSLAILGSLVLPKVAMANEGVAMLKGAGNSGACYAASVFVDGTYRVLATCRDLKMALSPEQNRYVVWVTQEDGKFRRLGEIVNGKMSMATDAKFTSLFVTAEADGYGNKPSESVLLSGAVQPINFGSGISGVEVAPSPTPTIAKEAKTAKVTPTETVTADEIVDDDSSQGVSGALSTVLKIALFGFGALLLVVGVFSFISRKRSL